MNILEGLGCILLSILIARDWYNWRQNPNRSNRIIDYNSRAFVATTGFFVGGIVLIFSYWGDSSNIENFSPQIYSLVFFLIGFVYAINWVIKIKKGNRTKIRIALLIVAILLMLIGGGISLLISK